MAITAQDVKTLRELTGVGMMDCKKALTEADGDMDKAVEWLREKGLAAAQKKAGRIAAEGMAYADVIGGIGVVVEVNAETDFVAKNDKFIGFTKGIAAIVAKENPADIDALMQCRYDEKNTVAQQQQEMVLVIGENITIRRFARYDTGFNVPYVHTDGRIGVMINMEVSDGLDSKAEVTELAKDLAMQVAALNPLFLDKSNVSSEVIEHEKAILTAQINEDPKNASKPEQIKEKMVVGRINKYYTENCLIQQAFVKDDKVSVEAHVAAVAKACGGTITVKSFVRFEKGEGIEKKQENFADEIASLIK